MKTEAETGHVSTSQGTPRIDGHHWKWEWPGKAWNTRSLWASAQSTLASTSVLEFWPPDKETMNCCVGCWSVVLVTAADTESKCANVVSWQFWVKGIHCCIFVTFLCFQYFQNCKLKKINEKKINETI